MQVTLWGTRGSIPTPGRDTVEFGGNTSCIEVRTEGGEIIILDAGSGIRPLGLKLIQSMPVTCSLLISHTHWDHIHGLPFFTPLFIGGNDVTIYGAPDPVTMRTIQDALALQMEYGFFPVRADQLKANITYETLTEGQEVVIGDAKVTTIVMNHTVLTYGYRVESGGKSIFYTGDHEPWQNIYEPGEEDYEKYKNIIAERTDRLVDFIRGVDLFVADAQYTEGEYPQRKGWGHATFDRCMNLAERGEVGHLSMIHHDPVRTDKDLFRIDKELRERCADTPYTWDLAVEGKVYEL